MDKKVQNILNRIEKNNGKQITLRRDTLVKMAKENLFTSKSYYSYDETFGMSEGEIKGGNYTKECEDCASSSVGYCSVYLKNNRLEFSCGIHSNRFFTLYIELEEEKEDRTEVTAATKEVLSSEEVQIKEVGTTTRIYFNGKPSEEVRKQLKTLGFRFFKNDGFYWGAYTNKINIEEVKSALGIEDTTEESNILSYEETIRNTFNTDDYYSIIERPINNKLCKDYTKQELTNLFVENNINFDPTAPKENLFLFLLDWIEEGDETKVTTEELKHIEEVANEYTEQIKEEIKEESNVLYFGIDGEGSREEKQNLTFEELETEFNARVRDERMYQEQYGKGGYCKTWVYIKYNGVEYRTCRLDLTGKEDLYICLSDAIEDVLKSFKNDTQSTCKYYFNSEDNDKCLDLIQHLLKLLSNRNKVDNTSNLKVVENNTTTPKKVSNVELCNSIYNEIEALENRFKMVTSSKLKNKLHLQIDSKTQELAKIIMSDELLYMQFMRESKE